MLISAAEARARYETEVQRLKVAETARQKKQRKQEIAYQLNVISNEIEEAISCGQHQVLVQLNKPLFIENAQALEREKYIFTDLGNRSHTAMTNGCNTTYSSYDVKIEW